MKKFVVAAVAALSIATSSVRAEESFYSSSVGQWNIFGNQYEQNEKKNSVCIAETTWKDGSKFQLTKDLSDGELYVWFRNLQWNIGDEPKKLYTMKLTAYGRSVVSGDFRYLLMNKNTIVIPNLQGGDFAEVFMSANKLLFYMPGTIENAELPLHDSMNAARHLARCIDSFKPNASKLKGTPI